MSGTSKAAQRAVNKYIANNYDRLNITVPKGKKAEYKAAAEAEGKSLNAFIVECVEMRLIMKEYVQMNMNEISRIVAGGGADLVDFLDHLDLSERVRDVIDSTEMRGMAEEFGGLMAADEVEKYVEEYYPEEEEE